MTAASGADQPTLRDQLAGDLDDRLIDVNARGAIAAVLADYLPGPAKHTAAHEAADQVIAALLPDLADSLLPFVERAQAEAAAQALEKAADDWPVTWAKVRARAASLRAGQGGDTG